MKMKNILMLVLFVAIVWSCKNDDDEEDLIVVPPRSLAETAAEDDAKIKEFLQTHFYNYEEFDSPPAGFDFMIEFDTIAGDNVDKTPLIEQVGTENISVKSSDFGSDDDEVVDHTLYYLIAREGVGEVSPTIGDYAVLHFEGSLLNGSVFDASINVETRFYLSATLRGFGNGAEHLKPGVGPFENGDGTIGFDDYGVGAIFMPSGLAYFSSPPSGSGIPSYTPLVFKIDLLSFEPDTDFDGDGIPSIMEDLDGDGNLNNDNTDQDTELVFFSNHTDADDDADGTPTIDEIEIDDLGNITFPDTDNDGTPDYLDADNP